MAGKDPEPCREFRHKDGARHACHRDAGHRGPHHADSGLSWGRHPYYRGMHMTGEPCPDCYVLDRPGGIEQERRAESRSRAAGVAGR
jgi:hypothetical protein